MSRAAESPFTVAVVRTGTANIASIIAGLARADAAATITDRPQTIRDAQAVVLPGVGSFSAAMKRLRQHELVGPLRDRIEQGRPTLAICLGMQLLFASSEESPDVEGLAVAPGRAKHFADVPRVPHMGWNAIEPDGGCQLLTSGVAYFANSFRIATAPEGWNAARTVYGEPFISAIERGGVLACQFHPELSGQWGQSLLRRWVDRARTEGAPVKGGASC